MNENFKSRLRHHFRIHVRLHWYYALYSFISTMPNSSPSFQDMYVPVVVGQIYSTFEVADDDGVRQLPGGEPS